MRSCSSRQPSHPPCPARKSSARVAGRTAGRSPAGFGIAFRVAFITFIAWLALIAAPLAAAEVSTNSPTFHPSLKAASESAATDGSPVLLIFGASWCPPCQALKKTTLPAKEFVEGAGALRIAEIDIDADEAMAARFGVQSVPMLFLLTADGKIVARQNGYLDAPGLLRWLGEGRARARAGQWEGTAPGLKLDEFLTKSATRTGLNSNDLVQLIALLGERDPGERIGAERLLLAQREKAVAPLIDALLNDYLGTRIGAGDALQRLAPDAPRIDLWQPASELGPSVARLRKWWAETGRLPVARPGATNDPPVAGSIQAALETMRSDDPVRRTTAMSTLASHGTAALPALRAAIKRAERTDPRLVAMLEDVRWSILLPDTLERRAPGARRALARGASAERQAKAKQLGSAGPEAIDALAELATDSDPLVVESAVRALSLLGGRDVIPALAALLKSPDSNLRMTAAQALGRTKSPDATRQLLASLDDPNEVVAGAAIAALVEVNAKDSPFNPAPGAKQKLEPETIAALGHALVDPRWRVRAAAAEASGKLQVSDLTSGLQKLLDDPDGFVVRNTLFALKGLQEQPNPEQLIGIARRLPALQGDVLALLSASATSNTVKEVVGLFNRANSDQQVNLLAGLGQRDRFEERALDVEWKPLLVTAQTVPAVAVRRQLAELLRLAPPGLAAQLVGALVGDDDARVRDEGAVVAFGVLSGRKKTAVGAGADSEIDLGQMSDDGASSDNPPSASRSAAKAPVVDPAQLAAWHDALARRAPAELTPLTAALFVKTGQLERDLPRLLEVLGRATFDELERLAQSPAVTMLAPHLPWPVGRPLLELLEKHPGLLLQAVSRHRSMPPEAAAFLLQPARFRRVIERTSGEPLKALLERLLTGSSGDRAPWSLLDRDPRTLEIVKELAQSTNAAWRAASVYVRGRHDPDLHQADLVHALRDANVWVRAAAIQALTGSKMDRADFQQRAGPMVGADDHGAAVIAALALLEPNLRQASGYAWQFEYFSYEDLRTGSGSSIGGTDAPLQILTNQPPYLALARRQLDHLEGEVAEPFALLLAQHGDFSGLDQVLAQQSPSTSNDRGGFDPPNGLLAAVQLSRNPRYLPLLRTWMDRASGEWQYQRLLQAVRGVPGPEARQLRLDLNRHMRFPNPRTIRNE